MDLGAFSVSLAVKDLAASRAFYEKFGFTGFAGNAAKNWLILKNGVHVIGLFQGMFEGNILTFNPGWDQVAQPPDTFTDVGEIQRQLRAQGMHFVAEADETTTGPAHFMAVDPDGNTILVDPHVWSRGRVVREGMGLAESIIASGGASYEGPTPISAAGRSFCVEEWSGSGPDYLHVHHSDDEAWHVLEGTLTFRFADRTVEADAGTTVFVPAGVAHSYYEAHGPTRYLIIMTPRLRELVAALHRTPFAQHGDVMRQFDSEIVE